MSDSETDSDEELKPVIAADRGDSNVRPKIDSLIAGGGILASILEEGAFPDEGATIAPTERLPFGNLPAPVVDTSLQIGRYKLIEEIGEGGFGMVYRAEQKEPVARTVALKVIKPGMDSREIIARFESERQTLALMEHPNIATVLDGGTTDTGRLFFVMELVKGIPITKYCDQHRLDTKHRLSLFLQVCAAIQHAHQKGIIHRDIKPSNILITTADNGEPMAKVIDFGIAKAFSEGSENEAFTLQGQIIGTPQYMSPEQADNSHTDIDTRSDIYSLGVLLYELLTGTTPIDPKALKKAGHEGIHRLICDEQPRKPSTRVATTVTKKDSTTLATRGEEPRQVAQMLRGDLDWIILKALEKERDRRYDTARGFARDIEAFLNNEAVSASPPTAFYLMRKFAARHRGLIAAMTAIAVSLILGTVGMTLLYVRAEASRQSAVHNLGIAQAERKRAENARVAEQRERTRAEAEADRRRRSLYASDLQLAGRNWNSPEGTAHSINQLLTAHVPRAGEDDLREFTWRHQWSALHRGAVAVAVEPALLDAVVATNGDLLTLGRDLVVRRWLGHESKPRAEHSLGVNWREGDLAAFVPDGSRVVHVRPGRIRVFDSAEGNQLREFRGIQKPFRISMSADSRHLGLLEAETMRLFTINLQADGSLRRMGVYRNGFDQFPLALAPGANGVAVGNLSGNGITSTFRNGRKTNLQGRHQATIQSLIWSFDGARLASGDGSGSVFLRELDDLSEAKALKPHRTGVMALVFSPDGRLLACGGKDGGVTLIDVGSGAELVQFKGHTEQILSLRFSADGRRLASSSKDGTARLWDLDRRPGYRRYTVPHIGLVITNHAAGTVVRFQGLADSNHIAVTDGVLRPGDRILAAGTGADSMVSLDTVSADRVVDLLQGEPGSVLFYRVVSDHIGESDVRDVSLRRSTNSVNHIDSFRLRFSPNGRWLVTGSKTQVTLLDWHGKRSVQWLPFFANAFAFSPDSRLLACNDLRNQELVLWDIEKGRLVDSWRLPQVGALAFSPDGKYLVSGRGSILRMTVKPVPGLVRVRHLATGEEKRLTGHQGFVTGLEFSPGGKKLAFASHDGAVQVYDTDTWSRLLVTPPVDEKLSCLKWSPDGEHLVVGGWEGSVYMWSSEGELIDILEGHSSAVFSLDFSPDRRTLATASRDMTVKLWDFDVRQQLRSLNAHDGVVTGVAFSRDGNALLTGGRKTDVSVWDAAPMDQIVGMNPTPAK